MCWKDWKGGQDRGDGPHVTYTGEPVRVSAHHPSSQSCLQHIHTYTHEFTHSHPLSRTLLTLTPIFTQHSFNTHTHCHTHSTHCHAAYSYTHSHPSTHTAYTHTHPQSHTHVNTPSLTHMNSPRCCVHLYSHTCSLSRAHTSSHTNDHTHSNTLMTSLSPTLSHSYTHSHTFTHLSLLPSPVQWFFLTEEWGAVSTTDSSGSALGCLFPAAFKPYGSSALHHLPLGFSDSTSCFGDLSL